MISQKNETFKSVVGQPIFLDGVILGCFDKSVAYYQNDENMSVIDYNGNELFSLCDYTLYNHYYQYEKTDHSSGKLISSYIDYSNGKLAVICEGKDENEYLCCFDKTGKLIFDPIKISGTNSSYNDNMLSFDFVKIYDDSIVYHYGDNEENYIYTIDFSGNEVKKIYAPCYLSTYNKDNEVVAYRESVFGDFVFCNTDGEIIRITD